MEELNQGIITFMSFYIVTPFDFFVDMKAIESQSEI